MFDSIAVVGATGAVGTIIRQLLEVRRFPFKRIKFLASARSAGKTIPFAGKTHTIEELKPEAMYFYPADGLRAGCIFLQSDNPAICAAVGERMWYGLQAQIKVTPVMNGEELGKGLTEIAKVIENYS